MIRRLIILLLIVGCEDSGTNTTTCMEEWEVESCSELAELYEKAQAAYDNLTIDLSNGIAITQVDIQSVSQTLADANKAKNQALYSLVGSGISAAVIWWWNVRDIGKSNSDQASTFQPLIFGINPSGQVQVIISL